MAERHERAAALIREYGSDPDGVERAMLAAGYGETTARNSRHIYAEFLRLHGYDVDGPPVEAPPEQVAPTVVEEPEPVELEPEAWEPDATAAAAKLMEKRGLDPWCVIGSGAGGRIVLADVEAYLDELGD